MSPMRSILKSVVVLGVAVAAWTASAYLPPVEE